MYIKGAKVPGNESSTEGKFHSRPTFVPGNEKAWERKGQGTNWPGSEKARERKGQGAKVPGSESARILLADLIGPGAKRLGTQGYTLCIVKLWVRFLFMGAALSQTTRLDVLWVVFYLSCRGFIAGPDKNMGFLVGTILKCNATPENRMSRPPGECKWNYFVQLRCNTTHKTSNWLVCDVNKPLLGLRH